MALPGGDTRIIGTNANDVLIGTSGNDFIRGFGGFDSIDGIGGDDYIEGGLGNDTLMGGAGEDWLIGGAGNDLLIGGSGADQFRFYAYNLPGAGTATPGHEVDTIQDLSFGEKDLILLGSFSAGTFSGNSRTGQLDIVNTGQGPGSGASIRSWAGLVDLVASSAAVTATQRPNTNTLLLRIQNGDGTVQTIAIENGWSIYSGLLNQAPTANPDANEVLEDGGVSGNLLTNDADPNAGDILSVTGIQTAAGPSQAVAPAGATIINGTYGTLTLQADGSYSYAADSAAAMALAKGVPAQDIFTYTVKDAGGKSATAQLVIKVTGTNDAPVAKALSRSITEKDAALNIQANFEDVDQGDTHVITVNSSGTIGKVVLNGDGTFSYDPNGKFGALGAGKTATDTFSYTVDDGKGGSSTQTVTITINGVNDDPTLISDFNGVVKNGRISVAADNGVLANDSDIDDGDKLAVSSINGSSSSLGSAVEGKYGALTMNADGSYSYAANTQPGALPAKMVAQDHFTYTVSDGEDGLKTETLIVTVHERGQTYIRGTDGANSLIGGNGSDVLDGGNGNDILFGGNGADALLGGRGDDIMTGGAGSDTFVFNANFGRDTITDFNKGLDALQFDKNVFADFASVLASATQSGNDVIIQAGGGNTITLQNFLLSNLSGSDFLFV